MPNTPNKAFDLKALMIILLMLLLMAVSGLFVIQSAKKPELHTLEQQSQQSYQWRMVTAWPKGFPGLGTGSDRFAQLVNEMSGGRLTVKVYGAGELVPAMGVFDVVSSGTIELGHGASYYWKGKSPAMQFFTTVPFGMTALEMNAWLSYGGGMALWQELYQPYHVIPLAGGNSGVQMAGWFNKEIHSMKDIKGLKMRIPGIAGEVFERIGGTAVNIAGGDLYISLKTGVVDALEWVGPYNDLAMGFQEAAKYYYYPGWHEPGSTMEFIVNEKAFQQLPPDLQAIVKTAAAAVNQSILDELTAKSSSALKVMVEQHGVQLRRLPDDVLVQLKRASDEVLQKTVQHDAFAQKVYQSYQAFYQDVRRYHDISEVGYIYARDAVERR